MLSTSAPRAPFAALRFGIELPALREASSVVRSTGSWSVPEVAIAAEAVGVGTLWLPTVVPGGLDAGPLGGAVAGSTDTIVIGIRENPSMGRHPAVLARDLSTLDLLSAGRAAVALVAEGGVDAPDRAAEAVGLVHRLLTETAVTQLGRFYEVTELTIRPRPVRPQGPPIVVDMAGLDGQAGGSEPVMVPGAAAYCLSDPPGQLERSATRLKEATGTSGALVLWRGELPEDRMQAGELVRTVLDEGVDGLIAVLGSPSAIDGAVRRAPVESVLAVIGPLLERRSAS